MTVDTRLLLQGLKDYRASLKTHLTQLKAEYERLEKFWQGFNAVAEGNYADDFRGGWLKTQARFKDYINQLAKILAFLNDRISYLEGME